MMLQENHIGNNLMQRMMESTFADGSGSMCVLTFLNVSQNEHG